MRMSLISGFMVKGPDENLVTTIRKENAVAIRTSDATPESQNDDPIRQTATNKTVPTPKSRRDAEEQPVVTAPGERRRPSELPNHRELAIIAMRRNRKPVSSAI